MEFRILSPKTQLLCTVHKLLLFENVLQVCVRAIFYLETWSSPDMTRSLIGQLLMSYTICFPTKRRIETVPTAEDFHEDTLRKIGKVWQYKM